MFVPFRYLKRGLNDLANLTEVKQQEDNVSPLVDNMKHCVMESCLCPRLMLRVVERHQLSMEVVLHPLISCKPHIKCRDMFQ